MERKTLKKKILGIICTFGLCICMTGGSTAVYGARVDFCFVFFVFVFFVFFFSY